MLARLKSSRFPPLLARARILLWAWLPFPLLVVLPVMGFYLLKPTLFLWVWIGYASLVYSAFFLLLTWLNYRLISKEETVNPNIPWLYVVSLLAAISVYQILLYSTALPQMISQAGEALGIHGSKYLSFHWPILIDFSIFTVYTVGLIKFFFGFKALKRFIGPIIYLVAFIGTLIIDIAYPFMDFVVLQMWVPVITFMVLHILRALGVDATYGSYGKSSLYTPRSGTVIIAWPCAGVHSLLIYTAVVYSFLQNLDISRTRKLIYVSLGFLGTYMVNILRVTAIIVSPYFGVSINLAHSYAGELFFITWIVVFLFVVVVIERRRRKAKEVPSIG